MSYIYINVQQLFRFPSALIIPRQKTPPPPPALKKSVGRYTLWHRREFRLTSYSGIGDWGYEEHRSCCSTWYHTMPPGRGCPLHPGTTSRSPWMSEWPALPLAAQMTDGNSPPDKCGCMSPNVKGHWRCPFGGPKRGTYFTILCGQHWCWWHMYQEDNFPARSLHRNISWWVSLSHQSLDTDVSRSQSVDKSEIWTDYQSVNESEIWTSSQSVDKS